LTRAAYGLGPSLNVQVQPDNSYVILIDKIWEKKYTKGVFESLTCDMRCGLCGALASSENPHDSLRFDRASLNNNLSIIHLGRQDAYLLVIRKDK
jgi:hypothetical protein